jgi:ABC-type nitrate/sulfonate/bicarbonate transport system substrate-binding protein
MLLVNPDFAARNSTAMRAFLADFTAATAYYLDNPREARKALLDGNFVRVQPDLYYEMQDYYRLRDGRIDIEGLNRIQEMQMEAGFQRKKVNLNDLVDLQYLPEQR